MKGGSSLVFPFCLFFLRVLCFLFLFFIDRQLTRIFSVISTCVVTRVSFCEARLHSPGIGQEKCALGFVSYSNLVHRLFNLRFICEAL